MRDGQPDAPSPVDERLVELVETLEAHGLLDGQTSLDQYVDPEALCAVLDSADDQVRVQFTVDGHLVTVTHDSVQVQSGQADSWAGP